MTDQYILTTESEDKIGIVARITTCLAANKGFVNELSQYGTPTSELFFSRIRFTIPPENMGGFKNQLEKASTELGLKTNIIPAGQKTRTLIMVSKFDHCLNDLLYRYRTGSLNIDVVGVVSNHENFREQTEREGIQFHHIPISKETKPLAEANLRKVIKDTQAELIVLARYMQILSEDMSRDFAGRIINIHHSFLPSFVGAKPYHRAHDRGVKLTGATAHYVTEQLDEGPIIEQMVTRIDHRMTTKDLIARGRDVEAQTLAQAVKLHSEHRVFINGAKTVIL